MNQSGKHVATYFTEIAAVAGLVDKSRVESLARNLVELRSRQGRLFILGVGGSAANASHAVNDFRKLCGIEAYAPTDNVSELTARINDEGWDGALAGWLDGSCLRASDALLIFSVGGGNEEKGVSVNLIRAIDLARERGAKVFGIVGRDGGYTGRVGDCVVVIPTVNEGHVTPLAEAYQAVVWHCLVSHPDLQTRATKW